MKRLLLCAVCGVALAPQLAQAQTDEMVLDIDVVSITPCKTNYYSTNSSNWFLQLGAGIDAPFLEYSLTHGKAKHHLTAAYELAFGKWMSPYTGWRISMLGGALHWDNHTYSKAKYVNANLDLMWDMLNSLSSPNPNRLFSLVPFVGLGGTFSWDFKASESNVKNQHGDLKRNQWTLPVSAGLQMRFRVCPYADIFFEGRAQFYGDNFNNCVYGRPIDINITAVGGITINFGGCSFKQNNACKYLSTIGNLNAQVNDLREALAATSVALAAAEAQLPCPEAEPIEPTTVIFEQTPLMATVRFTIDSDKISDEELVNVYNIAQWMQQNPDQSVVILGYADADTGTADYNQQLSQRRAQAVLQALTNTYGINADRLSIQPQGSTTQPYPTNSWNRIVLFSPQ
jgi:outer membrane protein OmpA-like peptidoglycan-associated protein/opacity protein-like surface antigen